MTFLDKIIRFKKQEVEGLYREKGVSFFKDSLGDVLPKPHFVTALRKPGLSLIAEIKKASPSKGVIRKDFDPVALAQQFDEWGASALSVLTDQQFFQGNPSYIEQVKSVTHLPVLRKDFLIDPIQVYESKCLGADAVLLIMAALTLEDGQALVDLARELSLDVLLEIHTLEELEVALQLDGVDLLGINNRDLKSFDVNLDRALGLFDEIQKRGATSYGVVAESGYVHESEMEELDQKGFSAVLIGEGLAKFPDLRHFWA